MRWGGLLVCACVLAGCNDAAPADDGSAGLSEGSGSESSGGPEPGSDVEPQGPLDDVCFEAVELFPGPPIPGDLVVGDLTGDGLADVVLSRGNVDLWFAPSSRAPLPWEQPETTSVLSYPRQLSVAPADSDGDGVDELWVYDDTSAWLVDVLDSGDLGQPRIVDLGDMTERRIVDVNGDGLADVIGVSISGGSSFAVQLGRGGHEFDAPVSSLIQAGWAARELVFDPATQTLAAALQTPENCFLCDDAGIAAFEVGADGTVSPSGFIRADQFAHPTAVAYMPTDQKPRVYVDGMAADIQVLRIEGGELVEDGTVAWATEIVDGDVNGDGEADHILHILDAETLSVMWRDSSGDVREALVDTVFDIEVKATGDINGDGYDDIIATGFRYDPQFEPIAAAYLAGPCN